MSESAKRYRAFISYSQKDKQFARRLHRALETYRLPRGVEAEGANAKQRTLGRFFRDDDEMGAATDLGAALRGAIADAENLIVVCSPEAARSRWVNEEITHFKRTGRADRIYAVIVKGRPQASADRSGDECFPPALRYKLSADGALSDERAEPLGLDIRKESFDRIVARLASGLIRTPFDSLWKREQRRRAQGRAFAMLMLTVIAAGALGVVFQTEVRMAWAQFALTPQRSHAALLQLRHLDRFTECSGSLRCPEMVVLEGGQFPMGSPTDEPGRFPDEFSPRPTTVSRFAIGRFPVTAQEWETCVSYTNQESLRRLIAARRPPIGCAAVSDSGFGEGRHPVINVSWDDAKGYVAWLNLVTAGDAERGPYRLLSEEEWEYAARGGTTTAFHWGTDPNQVCAYANGMTRAVKLRYPAIGAMMEEAPNCEDGFIETAPVDALRPNAFGLFDMGGNVWQWLEDCRDDDPLRPNRDADLARVDAQPGCRHRSLRGASWRSAPRNFRSARRGDYPPDSRFFDVGFRVARTL